MAAAHDNLLPFLSGDPGKAFVKDMTQRIYLWAEKVPADYYIYRIFTEVTIRKGTGEQTRLGLDKTKHYRFDAIFFIQPGLRALNQHQCYTVGVELKNSKSDLMGDKKIEEYIGYTDFFFIGVPENLIEEALERADGNSKIGVYDIESGLIIKLPKRIDVSPQYRAEIYEQVLYNTIFNELHSVTFEAKDVEISPLDLSEPQRDKAVEQVREQKNQQEIEERKEQLQAQKKKLAEEMNIARERLPEGVAMALETLPLRQQRVYFMLKDSGEGMQVKDLVESLPDYSSQATVKRHISELKDLGLIERQGGKKEGRYRIVENFQCKVVCGACARAGVCRDFKEV